MATNQGPALIANSAGTTPRTIVPDRPAGYQVVLDYCIGTTIGVPVGSTHLLLRFSDIDHTTRKLASVVTTDGQTASLVVSWPGGFRTNGIISIVYGAADSTGVISAPASTQQTLIVGYHYEA